MLGSSLLAESASRFDMGAFEKRVANWKEQQKSAGRQDSREARAVWDRRPVKRRFDHSFCAPT